MSKINILPEELSNRIAAGEVVERPASVVKELFENAVDAGADVVTVEIERAGSRLIRITDNGSGMDEEDALLCFSPHATSKIKNAEDIERITTFGFRGEALPSIASVAKLTLKTRTADKPEGLAIELEGGKIISRSPAGMAPGTVFAVRDLFFNVPARKKFLRSPATEEAHIQEMVIALSLGFPHVTVTLKFDGKIALQAPGEKSPAARAAGLFGKSFAGKMLPVNYAEEDIQISGLIAMPGFTRTSRREQRTFVNGRAVESMALYRVIRDGYGTLADFGRFPPTILNIELDAFEYDINVHPTKREVRFKREYLISRAVTNALRNALQQAPAPEIQLPTDKRLARPEVLLDAAAISYTPAVETPSIPGLGVKQHHDIFIEKPAAPAEDGASDTVQTKAFAAEDTAVSVPIPPAIPTVEKQPVEPISQPQPAVKEIPRAATSFTDRDSDDIIPVKVQVSRPPLAQELANGENMHYAGIIFGTFVMLEDTANENQYGIVGENLLDESNKGCLAGTCFQLFVQVTSGNHTDKAGCRKGENNPDNRDFAGFFDLGFVFDRHKADDNVWHAKVTESPRKAGDDRNSLNRRAVCIFEKIKIVFGIVNAFGDKGGGKAMIPCENGVGDDRYS